jgi:hypothetical protein
MTISSPQSLVIGSDTISAPRTSTGNNGSTYTSADGDVKLVVAHTYGKRTRRLARIQMDKFLPNPFNPAVNILVSGSVRVTLDVPPGGFTNTEAADLCDALADWVIANKAAFCGGEN